MAIISSFTRSSTEYPSLGWVGGTRIEDTFVGADSPGQEPGVGTPGGSVAGAPEVTTTGPVLSGEQFEDYGIDPNALPHLEPHSGDAVHPAPEVPLDPVVTAGDVFSQIPNTEEAADPIAPVDQLGWFDYDVPVDSSATVTYGGTVSASEAMLSYRTSLVTSIGNHFPGFDQIVRGTRSGPKMYYEAGVTATWGYGPRVMASYAVQPSWTDLRTTTFWTKNPLTEVIPGAEDTILYKVQAGVSAQGRLVRQDSVFTASELERLKGKLQDINVAERYRDLTATAAVAGDNHVAFLVIAYTRLVALAVAAEMQMNIGVNARAEDLDTHVMRLAATAATPFRDAVDAYLALKPRTLVTLPRGSSKRDEVVMLYLMGVGRLTAWTPTGDGSAPELVVSPFDRFRTDYTFKLAPVRDNQAVTRFGKGVYEYDVNFYQAQDLLTRYVNENQLWNQMAVARNKALGMCFSREFAQSISLPKPNHAMDPCFGEINTGSSREGSRRVFAASDSVCSVLASGQWLCNSMVEALLEGVINTMEESAGIGPRAKNFVAAIDTRQDDFCLGLKIGLTVLPVVEKFTECPSLHIPQYIAKSNVGFIKQLGLGWEARPFRVSSYLSVGVKPEDKTLGLIFDSGKRAELKRQRYFTWREGVVAPWLFDSVRGSNPTSFLYGTYYDDAISSSRTYTPNFGSLGTNQIEYLSGDPTLWDFTFTGTAFSLIPHTTSKQTAVEKTQETITPGGLFGSLRRAVAEAAAKESTSKASLGSHSRKASQLEANPEPAVQLGLPTINHTKPSSPPGVESNPAGSVVAPVRSQWSQPTRVTRKAPKPTGPHVVECVNYYTQGIEDTGAGVDQAGITDDDSGGISLADNQKAARKTARSKRNERAVREAELASTAQKQQEETDREAMISAISQNQQLGDDLLKRWPATKDEVAAVDSMFPRGEDAHLKRAIYTVGTLLRMLRRAGWVSLEICRDITIFLTHNKGGKNAWAVAIIMFLCLNDLTPPCLQHLKDRGLLSTPYKYWNDKWSNINDEFRRSVDTETWAYAETDFPQCLYLAGFVGRPHREADWEDEIRKRSEEPKPLRQYGNNGFEDMDRAQQKRMILNFLYKDATFKVKKVQSFEEYYKTRAEWMIRGSMAGEKTVLDTEPQVKKRLEEAGLKLSHNTTKVHVAEKVDYDWFRSVLDMDPIHLAKAHTKGQENGKVRSIQGSCYSHYVIGNYWSRHLEQTLTLKHATMNKSNSTLLAEKEDRRAASRDPNTVKVCADYPDFGATHSNEQQELILECILEVAMNQGFKPTQEFLDIHNWYKQSFRNQWWLCPGDNKWYRATMGMFSGVVQTTLFNTVMNGALFNHYIKTLQRMGSPIHVVRHYELGDDGWAELRSREEADSFIAVIPLCGKQLNPIKQLVSSYGSEYLREWYMQGSIYGCASRALAMLVSGNVESNVASAGIGRIQELYSSFCTLRKRLFKADVCQYFFEDLAVYEARRGTLGNAKVLRYLYSPKEYGGLALYPLCKMPKIVNRGEGDATTEEEAALDEEAIAKLINEDRIANKFKASRDYIDTVCKRFKPTWVHDGKNKAVARIAASGVAGGAKSTQLAHSELELAVRTCVWSPKIWSKHNGELSTSRRVRISTNEVEKQFFKATIQDQVLLSEVSKLAKVFKYVSKDSQLDIIARIATENEIPFERVRKTIDSLSYLRGEGLDYAPTPYLCAELFGIYTQWKVVNNFSGSPCLPSTIHDLYSYYRI